MRTQKLQFLLYLDENKLSVRITPQGRLLSILTANRGRSLDERGICLKKYVFKFRKFLVEEGCSVASLLGL